MGARKFDPETAQASRALQLRTRDDDPEAARLARSRTLHERLSRKDRQLLVRCKFGPIDVETVGIDVHDALWLVAQKLLYVWVDPADRVWVRTSILGSSVAGLDDLSAPARKMGRPRKT